MNLKGGAAALAVVAVSLSDLGASADTSSSSSDDSVAAAPAQPRADAPSTPEAPAEPDYVGFVPPPGPLSLGNSTASIRFGFLAQPQFELVGPPSDADGTTKNLYLRRIRVMVGGTLFKYFEYFFDTDYPDLFKVDTASVTAGTAKNAPGLNIQDAFITFKPIGDLAKLDAGFMLPPTTHNGIQGAGTLYSWDYFVNTFRRQISSNLDIFGSNGQNPNGRDVGVQARGLLFAGHIEYRAGLFQGYRVGPLTTGTGVTGQAASDNFFRVVARLQINLLDAEPGYFYQGTYLGARRILSVGGSIDVQDRYRSFGADAFLDLPVGPVILTAQFNFLQWDGGSLITSFPKSAAIMGEAGVLVRPIMLSPIARVEHLDNTQSTPTDPSEDRYGGGLAFWPFGHNSNLKVFYTRGHRNMASLHNDFDQVNAQWQVYFY